MMYSPDQANIDPRNPANWDAPKVFTVSYNGKTPYSRNVVESFDNEDFAKSYILNLSKFIAPELDVRDEDDNLVFWAEWDETQQRYLEE